MSLRMYAGLTLHALGVGCVVGLATGSAMWGSAATNFCLFLLSLAVALKDKP